MTTRASCWAGASSRSSGASTRSRRDGSRGRCELLGGKPAPALWYWAATLASAGLDDRDGALQAARAAWPRIPANAVLQNNLAVLLELSGDVAGAEKMLRAALAEDPALPQVSKNLADMLYRNGRYDEAAEAYERAAKLDPELGDDLYFKLGNIAYKRQGPRPARGRAGPGDVAQSRPRAGPGQPRDAGHDAMTGRRCRFRRAHAEDLARGRARARCLQGQVSPPADRGPHARLRRAHLRGLPALLDRRPAEYERLRDALTINVTRFYRNAETWNLLRRDVLSGADLRRRRRGDPGLERGVLVGRGAVHARRADRRPPRARAGRSDSSTGHHRRHRHRPASLERARAGRYRSEALTEMPATWLDRTSSRPATSAG